MYHVCPFSKPTVVDLAFIIAYENLHDNQTKATVWTRKNVLQCPLRTPLLLLWAIILVPLFPFIALVGWMQRRNSKFLISLVSCTETIDKEVLPLHWDHQNQSIQTMAQQKGFTQKLFHTFGQSIFPRNCFNFKIFSATKHHNTKTLCKKG